jgi:hypothetical protein
VVFTFTNYVDDSSVVWLNGVELFRFNVTATTAVPLAWNDANPSGAANPLGEGVPYITNVVATGLRAGDNVLAVQLQNQATTSSDDVFTLSLKAAIPTPVSITSFTRERDQRGESRCELHRRLGRHGAEFPVVQRSAAPIRAPRTKRIRSPAWSSRRRKLRLPL